MAAAFLTTLFFSFSAILAQRSIRAVGPTGANLGRLVAAALLLGVYAHSIGRGLGGPGVRWFVLSGVIGMGIGDLALFAALPLLGSRLSVLITQCLAAPLAALAEYLWLGTTLTPAQLICSSVILAGVGIALMPSKQNPPRVRVRPIGFVLGLCSAAGQGFGAVISRKANDVTLAVGDRVDGMSAAYQRIIGGLVITVAFFLFRAVVLRRNARSRPSADGHTTTGSPGAPLPSAPVAVRWSAYRWCVANALCGAVIGVSCYQWALSTTPSGLVLPIVATTPLVIVPLAYWVEGERPTRRSLIGGVIAVAGAVTLTWVR